MVSVGWKSAAKTASFEHLKTKQSRVSNAAGRRPRMLTRTVQAGISSPTHFIFVVTLAAACFPLSSAVGLEARCQQVPKRQHCNWLSTGITSWVVTSRCHTSFPFLVTGIPMKDPGLCMSHSPMILSYCGCPDPPVLLLLDHHLRLRTQFGVPRAGSLEALNPYSDFQDWCPGLSHLALTIASM